MVHAASGESFVYQTYFQEDEVVGGMGHETTEEWFYCPLCGWTVMGEEISSIATMYHEYSSVLQEFSLDTYLEDVGLQELEAYLKANEEKLYQLSWQRFEDLVFHIIKRNSNSQVVQTARSRDGGADIIVLSQDGSKPTSIIECKKYSEHRKVGLQYVQRLVGAAISFDVTKAMIYTSSSYSSVAKKAGRDFEERGFEVDLVDGEQLLSSLEVVATALPSLTNFSDLKIRQHIIETNTIEIPSTVVIPASYQHGDEFPDDEKERSEGKKLTVHVDKPQ